MSVLNHCVLCGAEELAPDVPGCTHTNEEYLEILRLTAAQDRARLHKANFAASLPPRYREYVRALPGAISSLNPDALAASKALSLQSFLYLHGAGGVGKTHVAVRAGAILLKAHGVSVLYVNEEDYFEKVERSYGGGPEAPDLAAPDVLIYDDAGKKPPSGNAARLVYRMLERRWAGKKATIITANRAPEALAASMAREGGEVSAILSRLTSGQVFEMTGIDGRQGSAL